MPNGAVAAHDDHGHHHPALQHHFENLEQQQEASTLGMWLFLVTEVMFFGGLILTYTLYRIWYPTARMDAPADDRTLSTWNSGGYT